MTEKQYQALLRLVGEAYIKQRKGKENETLPKNKPKSAG